MVDVDVEIGGWRPDGQLIDDTGHTMRCSGNSYDSGLFTRL
jgi:hypothetical protein